MLKIINLYKQYPNGVEAVKNLNIHVRREEIYCMLGANGAGKTTTVNMIFNFIPPTSGQILVYNIDVMEDPLSAKKHLAYVSENVMLYENFTGIQNLDFFARIGGKKDFQKADYIKILNKVGLPGEAHDRRIKTYSKGMRQKCGIAIAIAKNADIIILDEPTSGLDPKSGRDFLNLLYELKRDGKAILMTTHDIFRAREIADKVGIMMEGNLVKELTHNDFEKTDLEKIYLNYAEAK